MLFSGGTGTVTDPYRVATLADFVAIEDYLDKHFVQVADITGVTVSIAPEELAPFSGTYSGQGYRMGCDIPQAVEFGAPFGFVSGTVEKVWTTGTINGYTYSSGVVHRILDGGAVKNCGSDAALIVGMGGDEACGITEGALTGSSLTSCLFAGTLVVEDPESSQHGIAEVILGDVTNCWFDKTLNPDAEDVEVYGLTTAQLRSGVLPEGFDPAIWTIDATPEEEYPYSCPRLLTPSETLKTVTISSSSRGTVTAPGEGDFVYESGGIVSLVAAPGGGCRFINWSGSAVAAGKVADPAAPTTTILMDGDYDLIANFAMNTYLCTLADVKTRLGILASESAHDDVLLQIISGMTAVFANHCNRELLMPAAAVTEYHTGLGKYIQLSRYPIISITGIYEDSSYVFGADALLVADRDYRVLAEGKKGVIRRLPGPWLTAPDAVKAVYRGGYCAADVTPGEGEHALPADLREAAILQSSFIFKRRDDLGLAAVSFTGSSISKFSAVELLPEVKAILEGYRRHI